VLSVLVQCVDEGLNHFVCVLMVLSSFGHSNSVEKKDLMLQSKILR
jgi:hypothetical protein